MKQLARRLNSPRRGKSLVKVVSSPLIKAGKDEKSILKKGGPLKKSAKAKVHLEETNILAAGDEANPVVIVSPEKAGNQIDEDEVTTKTKVLKMSGFLQEPYILILTKLFQSNQLPI